MKKQVTIAILLCLIISLSACGMKSRNAYLAEQAISEIGVVTLDSEGAIAYAQNLCDQLSEKELTRVSNIQDLNNAQSRLLQLQEEAYQEAYQDAYDESVLLMLDTLVIAESMCNDIIAIWHNSIWKVDDLDTDIYTKDDSGVFYEDFNDALYTFEVSEKYLDYALQIQENNSRIESLNEIIKNPPEKFKGNMLDVYVNYYTEYQAFLSLAFHNNESYNSFTEKFDNVEKTSIEAYRKAAFYMRKSR